MTETESVEPAVTEADPAPDEPVPDDSVPDESGPDELDQPGESDGPAEPGDRTDAEVLESVTEPEAEPAPPVPSPVKRGPSPTGKRRSTGIARPDDAGQLAVSAPVPAIEDAADTSAEDEDAGGDGGWRRNPVVLAALLTVLAIGLGALAFWFRVEGAAASESTSNEALLNAARTSELKEQVTDGFEQLFSYNYTDTDKTEQAAKQILAGEEVRSEYEQLFDQIKKLAPEQQMVVTMEVVQSAVIRLEGDQARLLVFADQTSVRGTSGDTAAAPAQLAIGARFEDDRWKITSLDLFGQDPPQAPEGNPNQNNPNGNNPDQNQPGQN
ncbi:Mce-associated membrane protein [Tamaricihabitans halophyticus]|uniref:Mce-associated membrane protein n=1 Tax=Tamaricihabitans halophyticus TaxID=1262583 RepID=A0A4R2QTB9_9PSEU|nr:hypothetical protein [Tamaricihabitans halophyticus]TCP53193.1 Mce-associated membrane protein [Tamaricihabitans halophyticus]